MLKRGWFGSGLWRPKNVHSLDHLRYLYAVLSKNQIVQDNNRSLLVETLRSIAEILIWGDQNDSSVFDFFLEKNMLSFFLKIMRQKCGSYVCVQLLQTLNILFENIKDETSLYYLLSNNHVNSIIVHKFDFSDEEVMAYYISFLKTLSFKLNPHTIHFFYNESTNDFPLYTEAIKFFNHPETMVRIAVRTLTLNVYKVEDKSMLRFIRDRTAAPYFSNLVWFIGNHILEVDACVRGDIDHSSKNRLAYLVAEHLDHLHYINDILRLDISELNLVLADHLLNRLLVPLLVYSLNNRYTQDERPRVSRVVALFQLAQVFLIFSYSPLMQMLAKILLHGDNSLFTDNEGTSLLEVPLGLRPGFVAPQSLDKWLESPLRQISLEEEAEGTEESTVVESDVGEDMLESEERLKNSNDESLEASQCDSPKKETPLSRLSLGGISDLEATHVNITDEEKEKLLFSDSSSGPSSLGQEAPLASKPFLQAIMDALDCHENDYSAFFSLCLLYAFGHNTGVNQELLSSSLGVREPGKAFVYYNGRLLDALLNLITQSAQYNSKIRVVTLQMALHVFRHVIGLSPTSSSVTNPPSEVVVGSTLRDQHVAALEGAKEEATLLLRNFYKGEEIFLDMFEDEWRAMCPSTSPVKGWTLSSPMRVEFLLQDASMLLPPAGSPLTGIDFDKRLPCGEAEHTRRSMRVFFVIRALCLAVRGRGADPHLPLTNPAACISVADALDLNNSDLIACVVLSRGGVDGATMHRARRFLVIDVLQMVLVEPDPRKMGWGVAKFVGFLQDLEVCGDKDDSRVLHLTIHRPSSALSSPSSPLPPPSPSATSPNSPSLSAKFIFDDHIRCMAAKQRLTKGRLKARQRKLHQIARLLDLPSHLQPCPSPPSHALGTMRHEAHRRGSVPRSGSESRPRGMSHRSRFSSATRGPGVAHKKEAVNPTKDDSSHSSHSRSKVLSTPEGASSSRSRSVGPGASVRAEGEQIPLEDMPRSRPEDAPKIELTRKKSLVESVRSRRRSSSSSSSTLANQRVAPPRSSAASVTVCSVPMQVPVPSAKDLASYDMYLPSGEMVPVVPERVYVENERNGKDDDQETTFIAPPNSSEKREIAYNSSLNKTRKSKSKNKSGASTSQNRI